ncbi:MAG: protoporphyrinogen oxidase [Gemmatimonadota bacterium]
MDTDVVVLGAGISGLSCARRLRASGADVVLLEAGERPGGPIATERTPEGFLIEHGPQTVRVADPDLLAELDGLGGDTARIGAEPASGRRFVVWKGRPQALPHGPGALVRTPLLSARGKLRLLREPFVRARPGADPTVAEFVRGRLGPEVADRLVDPFVAGVYAGRSDRLSAAATLPDLVEGVRAHGSLLRWGLRGRPRRAAGAPRPTLVSFREGLGEWPRRLAEALGPALRLQDPAVALEPHAGGWIVHTGSGGTVRARAVVSALPAPAAAALVRELDGAAADALDGIGYAPVAVVHLGFVCAEPPDVLRGFGCLNPTGEGRRTLGTLFSSSLFPGRAPEGHVLTATFVGGSRAPEAFVEDDTALVDRALHEHRTLFGLDAPAFERVIRWRRAIPQYEVGHTERIARVRRLEVARPGLRLIGSWRGGVSVPGCWASGRATADAVAGEMRPAGTSASVGRSSSLLAAGSPS